MTVAQIEHKETFTESLPEHATLDRMEQLFIDKRRDEVLIERRRIQLQVFDDNYPGDDWMMSDRRNDLVNQITQSELRHARVAGEIVEVARLLVAEADNSELITE